MATGTENHVDREAGTVTLQIHESDHLIPVAMLWTAVAWAMCIGAVFLHVAGAGSTLADVVALGVSAIVGLTWCVIIFVAGGE